MGEPPEANLRYIAAMLCCTFFVVLYLIAAAYVAVAQKNYEAQQDYNAKINRELANANAAATAGNNQNRQNQEGGFGNILKMYGCFLGLNMVGSMMMFPFF